MSTVGYAPYAGCSVLAARDSAGGVDTLAALSRMHPGDAADSGSGSAYLGLPHLRMRSAGGTCDARPARCCAPPARPHLPNYVNYVGYQYCVEFQAVLDTMRHGIGLQGAVCRRPPEAACNGPCRRVRPARPVQLHEPRTQPKCVHMRGMQGTWRTLGSISTWHATCTVRAQPALARAIIRVAHSTARARHRISRRWALGRAIGSRARRCAMLRSASPHGPT
jgi:hypothetical protein